MAANTSPYAPHSSTLQAQLAALQQNANAGYANIEPLLSALSKNYSALPVEQICLGTGSNDLLKIIPTTLALQGVKRYIGPPNDYLFGAREAQLAGMTLELVPDLPNHQVDLAGMLRQAWAAHEAAEPCMVYFSNPNNPSGTEVSREALADFLGKLPPTATAVVDQAYGDFVPEEARFDTPAFLKAHPDTKVIFLGTASKAHGLAGERVGWALSSKEMAGTLNKVKPQQLAVTSLAAVAVAAALQQREYQQLVAISIRRGRDAIAQAFKSWGVECISGPHVNFVTAQLTPKQAESLVKYLLEQGYRISNLGGGYPGLAGCVRITIPSAHDREDLLEKLNKGLSQVLTDMTSKL